MNRHIGRHNIHEVLYIILICYNTGFVVSFSKFALSKLYYKYINVTIVTIYVAMFACVYIL